MSQLNFKNMTRQVILKLELQAFENSVIVLLKYSKGGCYKASSVKFMGKKYKYCTMINSPAAIE